MIYTILITIKVSKYPYFIELGNRTYDFMIIPRIGERIWIPDSDYIVNEITHFMEEDHDIMIKATLDEDYANFFYENKDQLIESLRKECIEFLEYDGWYINDYDLDNIKL